MHLPAALTPAPAPARQWTTAQVEPDQRLAYWVDAICEAFLEMDCDSVQAQQFEGQLTSLPASSLSLNRVMAAPQDVYRTRKALARSAQLPFYLITDAQHAWRASQDGQALCLQPGDAVLVDSSRPYEFHFDQGVSCLSVQIPRAWLGQWLSQPETRGLRHTRASQGWGRSLAALGQQWVGDLASARDLPEQVLADHLRALLGASFNQAPQACAPTAAQSDLAARALRQLQQDLASPGLTAPVVAQRLGVSTRTLHRCLAQAGHSFVQCLHRLRIQQACHMLDQPRLRHLMVGEVGRRCGFADASHFIRVFRQVTGHTPEAWRQRAHTTR